MGSNITTTNETIHNITGDNSSSSPSPINSTVRPPSRTSHFSFEVFFFNFVFFCCILSGALFHQCNNLQREKLWNDLTKYYRLFEKSGIPHGTAGYIIFRIIYSIGLLSSLEIISFICLLLYIQRKHNHSNKSNNIDAQQALKDPMVLKRFLGEDIPSWVTFPDIYRIDWIDQIVTNLWPEIAFSTEATIGKIVKQKLEESRPSFLTKLELYRCNLGSTPIKFNGAKTSCSAKETVIDLPISWNGKTDIRLVLGCSPVLEAEAIITNLQFKATIRIVLGPHVKKWPCFAAVSVCFLTKPLIDFDLKAAKVSLDAIPGLGSWLDSFLKDKVADFMVHPRRLTFPTVPEYSLSDHSVEADALGTLMITITRCNNLPSFLMTNPTSYVKLGLANEDEINYYKTAKVSSTDPTFDETFRFTIYNRHMQIKLLVCSKPTYSKIIKSSKVVGYKTLYVNTLMDGDFETTERLHDLDFECDSDKIPTVSYRTTYKTFKSIGAINNQEKNYISPTPPHKTSSRIRKSPSMEPVVPTYRPPRSIMCNTSIVGNSSKETGTLFITVDRCNNIKNTEMAGMGKADLYVILMINGKSCKTNVVRSSLDPVFACSFELAVDDALRDTLEVLVNDYERIGNHKKAGKTSIMISDVKKNNGRWKNTWSLEPQGTISMELKLLLNAH